MNGEGEWWCIRAGCEFTCKGDEWGKASDHDARPRHATVWQSN